MGTVDEARSRKGVITVREWFRTSESTVSSTNQVDILWFRPFALACAVVVTLVACARHTPPPTTLDIATTTSVQNSGLLDALLPYYTVADVRVHAAGSGRALEMLQDRIVDLVISHAPDAETRYLTSHRDWSYQKLAFNRFVLVGPASDPAHVKASTTVVDAFRRIAATPVNFVSRGDSSGTHEREQKLWGLAGVEPASGRLLTSGQGMANTLRQADEKRAYTLSDEATFWQLQRKIDLVVVSEGDELLLNTYAVIRPRDGETAARFADWLTRGEGRTRIERHLIEGRVAFHVWPLSCPGDSPTAMPCS
jgi:tungstate transport system substrate-binding protein